MIVAAIEPLFFRQYSLFNSDIKHWRALRFRRAPSPERRDFAAQTLAATSGMGQRHRSKAAPLPLFILKADIRQKTVHSLWVQTTGIGPLTVEALPVTGNGPGKSLTGVDMECFDVAGSVSGPSACLLAHARWHERSRDRQNDSPLVLNAARVKEPQRLVALVVPRRYQ
jgi:hypothetical protein